MSARRTMGRVLSKKTRASLAGASPWLAYDAPRRVRNTIVDFSALKLPPDVRRALAEAFWSHFGVRGPRCTLAHWFQVRVFGCFARQSGAIRSLSDLHGSLLSRYIEWLNARRRRDGEPWSKSNRYCMYATLRTLLQWLERCRPGLLAHIEYPYNPFPWKNRDMQLSRGTLFDGGRSAVFEVVPSCGSMTASQRTVILADRVRPAAPPASADRPFGRTRRSADRPGSAG
jgi:hypothetical protein